MIDFTCSICGKEFDNAYSLGGHVGWHSSGPRYTSKIPTETRICGCGCEETFECKINSKQKYVHGHNRKGKKEVPRETRVCLCGCGKNFECLVTSKKRYVRGHGKRIPTELRICICGCRGTFRCKVNSKQKYLPGHNNRGKKFVRERQNPILALEVEKILTGQKLAPLCACGCGNRIKVLPHHSYVGIPKYIHGHHHKGKSYVEIYGEKRASKEFYKRLKSMQVTPNNPETKISIVLKELYCNQWNYTGDGQIILGGRCPDFTNVNGQKKIIELFGDYWHSEEVQKVPKEQHEKERIRHFAKYGYQTLIIWEYELEDMRKVVEKIQKFNYV